MHLHTSLPFMYLRVHVPTILTVSHTSENNKEQVQRSSNSLFQGIILRKMTPNCNVINLFQEISKKKETF